MRFMIIVKATPSTEAGILPTEAGLARMDALNTEMAGAGVVLVAGGGLKPSAKGARVSHSGGKTTITDGPFTESKELIAGFSIVEVASKAAAITLAERMLQIIVEEESPAGAEIEVRPLYEGADFDPPGAGAGGG